MFYRYYIISLACMVVCAIIGGWASNKVHSAYRRYDNMLNSSHMTGYDTAQRLLRANGIRDIRVGRVQGSLTDHYHPKKKEVNLSERVYGNNSLAACAVAAHEIGHVVQERKGYFPYKIRNFLVTATNIGSRLALPLVVLGLILDVFVAATQNSDVGFYLAIAGVALYGLSTLFALATLPVELDASRRAKKMLLAEGILTEEEAPYAGKMLSAAAMTYVASLLVSLIYFLRFFLWVMMMFGNRRRD
ncbi:MAG: zinc metallopeptidase [Clostridia bacterium]|nr:zinc metallopeptidase [Clostridia bacterium]